MFYFTYATIWKLSMSEGFQKQVFNAKAANEIGWTNPSIKQDVVALQVSMNNSNHVDVLYYIT